MQELRGDNLPLIQMNTALSEKFRLMTVYLSGIWF